MVSKKNKHKTKQSHAPLHENGPYSDGIISFFNRYGLIILTVFVVLYIAAFSYISVKKYQTFSYFDFDLAIYNQVVWNTVHGDFMYSTIRENLYEMPDGPRRVGRYFKDHVEPILIIISPIYAIFKSPLTLLMLQTFFLGAGAIPLYLIARRFLHGGWAFTFGLAYLLYAPVGYINLFEFHPLAFAPFFFLFAIYFMQMKRFALYIVFLTLAMFTKEEVGITVFMFGVWALITSWFKGNTRESLKWIIVPSAMGIFWLFFTFGFLSPRFNQEGYIYTGHFEEMGGSIGGIIKTTITDPLFTIRHIFKIEPPMINKPLFLLQLFLPLLFLSFLCPLLLLVIAPQLFLYLASSKAATSTIFFQYTGAVIPFVFASAVCGLSFIQRKLRMEKFWGIGALAIILISLISSFIWGPQLRLFNKNWDYAGANTTGFYNRIYVSDHLDEARHNMVEAIPPDASVVTTFRFLSHLSSRRYIYTFHYIYSGIEFDSGLKYVVPDSIEYALLDYADPVLKNEMHIGTQNIRNFIYGRKYGLEKIIDSLVLFKEGKEDLSGLYQVLTEPPVPSKPLGGPAHRVQFMLGRPEPFDYIELLGTDVELIDTEGTRQVKIDTYWKCINPAPVSAGEPAPFTMNLVVAVVDSEKARLQGANTPPAHFGIYPLGYEIYPSKLWKQNEIVRTTSYVALPKNMASGKYDINIQPLPKLEQLRQASRPWGVTAGTIELD